MKITKHVFSADRTEWLNEKSELHREDGPAIEYANGSKHWYKNGLLHREDGPAIENANGFKVWYRNGEYHRDDGPAVVFANGKTRWWFNNNLNCFESEDFLKSKLQTVVDIKQYIINAFSADLDKSEIFLLRLTIKNHFADYLGFLDKLLILK